MVEDFPAILKAIFDPNYGNIRPVSQPSFYYVLRGAIMETNSLNTRVIPYNPFLLLYFNIYINVKIYNTINAIRYIYKYIFKGYDLFCVSLKERDKPN
jgi:hypothetical protein